MVAGLSSPFCTRMCCGGSDGVNKQSALYLTRSCAGIFTCCTPLVTMLQRSGLGLRQTRCNQPHGVQASAKPAVLGGSRGLGTFSAPCTSHAAGPRMHQRSMLHPSQQSRGLLTRPHAEGNLETAKPLSSMSDLLEEASTNPLAVALGRAQVRAHHVASQTCGLLYVDPCVDHGQTLCN